MKPFAKAVVLALLLIVVLYWSAHPQSAPVKTDLKLDIILGALGGLFVLVLLIERATEIVISIWREAQTEKLQKAVEASAKAPSAANDLATNTTSLIEYQADTKGIALMIGFGMSVVACAGGVGILKTIVDTTHADPNFMRGIDIVLTSGLLAGGSDSFHQFVRALETFFGNSRKKTDVA